MAVPSVLMKPTGATRPAPDLPPHVFEALFEIGNELQTEELDLDRVLDLIVVKLAELMQVDVAWLGLLDEDDDTVRIASSHGARERDFTEMTVPLGLGVGGVALRQKCTLVIPDYTTYEAGTPEFVHDVMTREGIVSLMCSPMILDDTMVGTLYAGNRYATSFEDAHSSLLSTLASQACIAIKNARLYRELESRNRLLEQSFAVHNELTAVAVRERGLDEIGQTLARIVRAPLIVEQQISPPFCVRYGPNLEKPVAEKEGPKRAVASVPILAGDDVLGQISVVGGKLSELRERALDHGATVMALELLKRRTALEVELKLRGELLEELLEASGELPEALTLRAERMRVDPHISRRLLALEPDDDRVGYGRLLGAVRIKASRVLGGERGPALAVKRGGRVILAIPQSAASVQEALVLAIQGAVRQMGSSVSIGVSRPQRDLALAYREAIGCLRLAKRSGKAETVVDAGSLGPLRFMLDGGELEHAVEMVRDQLGAVIDHDATARAPLLDTLRIYLEVDGHQATVAARCYIHVSTLKYRIGRLRTIMGVDLSDPDVRFDLRLAFRLADVLEALDISPPATETPVGAATGSSLRD